MPRPRQNDDAFTRRFESAAILQAEHVPVAVPITELFASAPDTTA